jgi:hypothetical protein
MSIPPHSGRDITKQHKLLASDYYYYDSPLNTNQTNLVSKEEVKESFENLNNLIRGQINFNREMSKIKMPISGFDSILDKPYLDVWSAGNFFRNSSYQKGSIFYEQPFKDIRN